MTDQTTCAIEWCNRIGLEEGLCSTHLYEWQRHYAAMPLPEFVVQASEIGLLRERLEAVDAMLHHAGEAAATLSR